MPTANISNITFSTCLGICYVATVAYINILMTETF